MDGRCTSCGSAGPPPGPTIRCPKCRASVEKGKKYCEQCGAKIPTRADRIRAMNRSRERQENLKNVNRGRVIILVVAVFTLLAAGISYFSGMSDVEQQIREADRAFSGLSSTERDERMKETTGMTWQEAVDQDRGRVKLQGAILAALAVIFLALWWWAQTNPFGAALSALLLYVTVTLIGAMVDPASLLQGIIIKGLIVAGLFSAVSAGYRERQRRRPA